ncbi:MAG: phosphoribosylamine---glycine ligase [Thermococcaceae archaeon]|nr:phosphoribosylamine---glycine ligase [Thermococcaceae archaeon]
MEKYKIPGRKLFRVFDDIEEMKAWIDEFGKPVVVKPLGLTGGKGVKVVGYQLKDNEEAKEYAKALIEKDGKVLIEERTDGVEFTFQVFTDGKKVIPMPLAQDYPHAYEGDVGPITGGMGSYSCEDHLLPFVSKEDYQKAFETLKKTIEAMSKEGIPYKGITSLVEIGEGIIDGNLKKAEFEQKATVVKYVAPKGYPTDDSLEEAEKIASHGIKHVNGEIFYRTDVGTQESIEKRITIMKKLRGELND